MHKGFAFGAFALSLAAILFALFGDSSVALTALAMAALAGLAAVFLGSPT